MLESCGECIVNIRNNIKSYLNFNRIERVVFGISGGVDSAVIAGIMSDLLYSLTPLRVVGAIIPIESDYRDAKRAKEVSERFGIPIVEMDMTGSYHRIMESIYDSNGSHQVLLKLNQDQDKKKIQQKMPVANGNIKARLRMIALYDMAQKLDGIVMSTDNYSELCMGFWTICGDVGDIAPLQYLLKTEVYQLAEHLKVPQSVIDAKPTDGLDVIPGGGDEDQLGMSYNDLDKIIVAMHKLGLNPLELPAWPLSEKQFLDITELAFERGNKFGGVSLVTNAVERMRRVGFKHKIPIRFNREQLGLDIF